MSDPGPPELGNEDPLFRELARRAGGLQVPLLGDTEIWGLVFGTLHWNCGGWSTDGDGLVICACGTALTGPYDPDTEAGRS